MKRSRTTLYIATLTLALIGLLPFQARAVNFSLTLDGLYNRDLSGPTGHANASGGSALFEIEPTEYFSLGVAANLNNYWGVVTPNPLWAGSLDGVIRLMPWGIRDNIESYILLGGGINALKGSSLYGWDSWNGNYHFEGAVGLRYFLSPHFALDGAIGGDYYDPFSNPLTDLTTRIGLSFYALPAYKEKAPEDEFKPELRVGSLQYIAKMEYGDPDLYPILVDANFKNLKGPFVLPKGAKLIIPRNLTKDMILQAHERAVKAEYLKVNENFDNPTLTAHYEQKVTTLLDAIPVRKTKRSTFPYRSEMNLWDIAARPDVLGDPELYPLLFDANRIRLKRNGLGGFNLTVPRQADADTVAKARIKAWAVEYIRWRGKKVKRSDYLQWRHDHGLPDTPTASEIGIDDNR